ncbi:glycosyltransferase family 2 protein [Paraburkholderia silviterrae]|uniref:Glycosyltransferase family 2 protein n=1 Tax=Paraburkholderia silviterrae TaxID=2528715 RepID=A0A4R5LZ05_9BURK|nr:glycosyltransferase family 2 protein [Paraburkholderia silviterrae]TDG17408.1 glycosyltransferase family 2 protein [Paraburkholderia silviterrae]
MNRTARPDCWVSISVVTYHPDRRLLEETMDTLADALEVLASKRTSDGPPSIAGIWLVDNGGTQVPAGMAERFVRKQFEFTVVSGHGNVGYGRGHNLAIMAANSEFHLVLNPDVRLSKDAMANAVDFMMRHEAVGMLAPYVSDDDGKQQYLCRRFPKVADLVLRGFAPRSVQRMFRHRLDRYEMRDRCASNADVWDPAIVSGCFMLCRTRALQAVGGFDPSYFLYFEDYDLSLRIAKVARLVYCPAVRIVHHGGGAARKGAKHIRMFAVSAVRFFNRFGWRWL